MFLELVADKFLSVSLDSAASAVLQQSAAICYWPNGFFRYCYWPRISISLHPYFALPLNKSSNRETKSVVSLQNHMATTAVTTVIVHNKAIASECSESLLGKDKN